MTTSSLSVDYTIKPPKGVEATGLKQTSTINVPIATHNSETESGTAYYDALRTALADTKSKVGDELTVWRDAVGKLENTKETKKQKSEDEDEDEDDVAEEE